MTIDEAISEAYIRAETQAPIIRELTRYRIQAIQQRRAQAQGKGGKVPQDTQEKTPPGV